MSLLLVFNYVLILFLYVIPLLRVVSCDFKNSSYSLVYFKVLKYICCRYCGCNIKAFVIASRPQLWLHQPYQGPQQNHICHCNLKLWFILYRICVCFISMLPTSGFKLMLIHTSGLKIVVQVVVQLCCD